MVFLFHEGFAQVSDNQELGMRLNFPNRQILAKTKQRSVPERESERKGLKVTSGTEFALYHWSSRFFICAHLRHWPLVVFAESAFCVVKVTIGEKRRVFFVCLFVFFLQP